MNKRRILVCPLDWGLGHAARCVPVIKQLLKSDAEVIVASDKNPLAFLQKEFPHLEFIKFPGYEISYASSGSMVWQIGKQVPSILKKISKEHLDLQKIIKKHHIDGVVSDNRYGLWTKEVPCVFIAHQIMVKSPFLEGLLYKISRSYIDKFTECWIPDFADEPNLSGDLSHRFPLPENARFIGALSRFSPLCTSDSSIQRGEKYELFAIISGPEPQRTVFEEKVLYELKKTQLKALIVKGKANESEHYFDGHIEIHSHLETEKMREAILNSKIVLSRPGYSTIMDLAALGKKAIFIPTLGQTEQEYLAKLHHKKGHFYSMNQKDFDLGKALATSRHFTGLQMTGNNDLLADAVKGFLE